MTDKIIYKGGYKYQLFEEYDVAINIKPKKDIIHPYFDLYKDGVLRVKKGYAWDGPSGPTFDTKNFMRGSLVHDVLYQLLRENLLEIENGRNKADLIIKKLCIEDGMSKLRAQIVYLGLKWFGKSAASEKGIRPILTAP